VKPYVSIVINTAGKNIASIGRLLRAIKTQNFKSYEVIIATESNGDKLEELCKQLNMDCRVIETGYWNRCMTGNIGILRSRGELVAILEDDVVLEPSWLTKLVAVLTSDKDVGCTYSAVINPFGSESIVVKTNKKAVQFIVKALNTLRVHNHFARKKLNVFSLTVICRKEALLKAGLFDMNVEEPIVAEDYDLALRVQRAGYKIIVCGEAKALHYSFHMYKRALTALGKGPQWWGKLVENDTYFFAKHYDVLGIFAVLMHTFYNAFFSPLASLLKLGKVSIGFLLKIFLYSIEGSFAGFIRGLLVGKFSKGIKGARYDLGRTSFSHCMYVNT
jgi:cellulose synthase/poly-beta-1,6-N-acetylglucosamine synthase-like glycosyltransferase